jgi:hypothetical protein
MSNQPTSNPSQSNPSVQPGAAQQQRPGAPGNKGDQDDRQEGQRSGSQNAGSDRDRAGGSPSNQRQAQSNDVAEESVESEGDPSAVIDKQGH